MIRESGRGGGGRGRGREQRVRGPWRTRWFLPLRLEGPLHCNLRQQSERGRSEMVDPAGPSSCHPLLAPLAPQQAPRPQGHGQQPPRQLGPTSTRETVVARRQRYTGLTSHPEGRSAQGAGSQSHTHLRYGCGHCGCPWGSARQVLPQLSWLAGRARECQRTFAAALQSVACCDPVPSGLPPETSDQQQCPLPRAAGGTIKQRTWLKSRCGQRESGHPSNRLQNGPG